MKSKSGSLIGSVLIILAILAGGYFFWRNSVGTINIPDNNAGDEVQDKIQNLAGLTLPSRFSLSVFADDVKGARVIELDPKGRLFVSQTNEGKISVVADTDGDGARDVQKVLKSGLNKPHGMASDCREGCFLYVALRDKLVRYSYDADAIVLGEEEFLTDIASSPADRHYTRHIIFLSSPDEDTLLISVGSSCDVCVEKDTEHASVLSYNIKTGKKELYAKGLRNATFMTLDFVSGKVFATEMGRDNLGDELPPDEINIIEKGKDYGWPYCYGKNIRDTDFSSDKSIRCTEGTGETPSLVDLPAHSAPLGLAFIPEEGWPEEYWYDLLVAYHGSWNRSEPTGYKIARLKFDAKGQYSGTEDFITGWLTEGGEKTGRPVDIKVFSGGTAYISDDTAGVIYKLQRTEE